ncbi:MAG: T9SS C-terminal target domain-containing protein [Bacteroidetes bacterium]|nr:MAG: T9SS C-terminal target domain-containing protein [Bacteroidota bacterium]
MKNTLLLALYFCSCASLQAQDCQGTDEQALRFVLKTDGWGYESFWSVTTLNGDTLAFVGPNELDNNVLYDTIICIGNSECISFRLNDTYGDGLINEGYFTLMLNGDTIADNPFYDFSYERNLNCLPGAACSTAEPITEGIYTTTYDNHWYVFTPDSVGTYLFTTCDLSDCDTKIWIYDTCDGIGLPEDNEGITFFDDNDSECAPQAQLEAYFAPGISYYVRIGDNRDACGDEITWSVSYLGPVIGCTDPSSCNFNPLASVDDGSCLPQGDPDCPDGPDLLISQEELAETLLLTTIENNDPCLIEEGCVSGYGRRDVIRFSTKIDNIGATDYYIGQPSADNSQFTWNNCHNHFHYDGYAEYLLFREDGSRLPSSFKNGFCVIDLGCDTGTAQYGCNNMGITAGCYDRYWRDLGCQWIDITDVPDGNYFFVTRVNWDNAPDALGRVEKDTLNNWAQVCLHIDRSSGELLVNFDVDCAPYVDCAGVQYGNTLPDCNGDCGGTAVLGDINEDHTQDMQDARDYITSILAQDDEHSGPCYDLNGDGKLSVYDAALLADCQNYGRSHVHEGVTVHDHCNLPGGIFNHTDTTTFTLLEVNTDRQFIDIGIRNPSSRIVGYQLQLTGVDISGVTSLVPIERYPVAPQLSLLDNTIIGMSFQDSTIERSQTYQPLCRIFYTRFTDAQVCLTQVEEAVNALYEQTVTVVEDGCVQLVGVHDIYQEITVSVTPNPWLQKAMLSFPNPTQEMYHITLHDALGRRVRSYATRGTDLTIERGELRAGVYFYELRGVDVRGTGRLVVQ